MSDTMSRLSSKSPHTGNERNFSTPMMQQYAALKQTYADYLLLYRLGDFYELFMEDAEIGARILQIVLTKRPRGKDGDIPMAGVPYHAVDRYIGKLVQAGYKVAICEQVTQAGGKGIVERDVVRIVTPGTVLDEQTLDQKEHNYIMALSGSEAQSVRGSLYGMAVADLSTGIFQTAQIDAMSELIQICSLFDPSEILLSENQYNNPELLAHIKQACHANITRLTAWDHYTLHAENMLKTHFKVASLKGFGIGPRDRELAKAAAALLGYFLETQKGTVNHIRPPILYKPSQTVSLDSSTLSNLEVFKTLHEGRKDHTLVNVLDKTSTAMGGRMLKEWLRHPLRSSEAINQRLDSVEYFVKNRGVRESIVETLSHIYDVERLLSRLSVRIGNPADVLNIASSIEMMLSIRTQLLNEHAPELKVYLDTINPTLKKIAETIRSRLTDDPTVDVRNGGFIRDGYNSELDGLRRLARGGKDWLLELEQSEKSITGITSLKVRFNKVFGYYIEVSKSYVDKVPNHYMRIQTLVNAERFSTQELKEYEHKILRAQEKIDQLEYEMFQELVKEILLSTSDVQHGCDAISQIDCLVSLAIVADLNYYCRPDVQKRDMTHIENGRHPVIEQVVDIGQFVPNSVVLGGSAASLHIITGPNMAGKSVYIRQIALITLMAHIGSFVPAQKAEIGLVDRIFVRSGASDMITSGLSTFMVEMVETAYILNHATAQSLIVLDEIGRGTSTYDGISIAWAVAEYLVTHWGKAGSPKTLFATHYHELQKLTDDFPHVIANYHMAVEDHKGVPIFLHRVVRGESSHSYGVAVAQLAGVPEDVIQRARLMLQSLESTRA